MRTLDVAVLCYPERTFKAALTAAQRAVRGMVKDGLCRRYKTERFQTIYALTRKGAAWLEEYGVDATSSVRRTSDMTNPEHRLWLQLLTLAAEARGVKAETEQELLRRLNQGASDGQAMVRGPLVVQLPSAGKSVARALRPDALLSEPDGATWIEVDRSKRGGDREAALRALVSSVGAKLSDGQQLRRVVVLCKTERIRLRALAVIRSAAADSAGKVLVHSRRHFTETTEGTFKVTAAVTRTLPDGRVTDTTVDAGHVIVQLLPTWLPRVRMDSRNKHPTTGWMSEDYLPYRRSGCGAPWPRLLSPLLAKPVTGAH